MRSAHWMTPPPLGRAQRRSLLLVPAGILLALAAVGCSGNDGEVQAGSGSSAPTAPTAGGDTTATTDGGGGDAGVTAPAGSEAPSPIRYFEVAGVEVQVMTPLEDLPDHATVVRFSGTLIDSGDGLELCMGGVALSEPPQCSGPVIDGLDPAGWTGSKSGVTWGSRRLTVAWPPADPDHLTLVSADPIQQLPSTDDGMIAAMSTLPPPCEGIERFTDRDTVSAYATAHPDQTGALWVTQPGEVVVLGVVEAHLEAVRAALTTGDGQPCLVPMRHSTDELDAAGRRLAEAGMSAAGWLGLSWGQMGATNQLTVEVAVADRATVKELAALFDDPAIIRVVGTAEILDGDR